MDDLTPSSGSAYSIVLLDMSFKLSKFIFYLQKEGEIKK